jgi:integrase
MHGSHLTQRGSSWVFQLKVPVEFKTLQWLKMIRLNLGQIDKRSARRAARALAGSATKALEKVSIIMPEPIADDDPTKREAIREAIYRDIEEDLRFVLPLYGAIGGTGEVGSGKISANAQSARDVRAGLMTTEMLRSVGRHPATLGRSDQEAQDGLVNHPGFPMRKLFELRQRQRPLSVEEQLSRLTKMVAQLMDPSKVDSNRVKGQQHEKPGPRVPLFSEAADAYYELLRSTNGDNYDELKYIRHRKKVFLEIIGDKPVGEYNSLHLQEFINRVRFLPPNHSKMKDFEIQNLNDIIDQNIKDGHPGLSQRTLMVNYVGKIKTILRYGCTQVGVPYLLEGCRLIVPASVPKPKRKFLLSEDRINDVFRAGLETGKLAESLMPLVGYLTGRRLGLVAFLRGEQIRYEYGHWIVTPRSHDVDDGKVKRAPVKTTESLGMYVLHDFLAEIGFSQWASQQAGYVFREIHGALDPADTASKRMARLFQSTGLDPDSYKMFHGLRHLRISDLRDSDLKTRTIRMQVGHELTSEHEKYGEHTLRPKEIKAIATVPLSPDIDWSIFRNLDFKKFEAELPLVRRRRRLKKIDAAAKPASSLRKRRKRGGTAS